ncbi:hypothetical protein BT96DRAFT_1073032 [Gymnopus androsaceus JB14]|uniref:GH16 domain-containing protein n=1 Tax=Gymnopus androsaceus JB14 TaxID=1447944 RepID=A0A6A4GTF0_9AGAR|nr:hypothetical protein BT96DRAFT_1073032 [Gymnopus androsaceus JB14]
MAPASLLACVLLLAQVSWFSLAIYVPVREYSGPNFFSLWDYYDNVDNTTWGMSLFISWLLAFLKSLTYVDPNSGHAIIRVDNTTNIPSAPVVNRNSVKITSKDAYPIGSLITIDVSHIPYGCSVWPSFWMLGTNIPWPNSGEIDIIEAINNLASNQYALHTTPGCFLASNTVQTGIITENDCSTGQGCVVQETKPNSFGSGFAEAGGGVVATQLDVSGIFMWFWPRSNIPASISNATTSSNMDLSDWGTPTAAYVSSACNISEYFQPQNLVIDITLCGVWAGVPSIYNSTGCSGQCINNVIGTGNPIYNEAYWDISYIRTYIASADANATTSEATSTFTATATVAPPSTTSSSGGNSAAHSNAAAQVGPKSLFWVVSSTLFAIWLSTMALGA